MWVSPEDEIQQGPAHPELHPGPPAAPHPSQGGHWQGFPRGEPRHRGRRCARRALATETWDFFPAV